MHAADDRATGLTALKVELNRFESLGLVRDPALSIREYLATLAAGGAIEAQMAAEAASLYDRCRYGQGDFSLAENAAVLEALAAAAEKLEVLDEPARMALVAQTRPTVSSVPRAKSHAPLGASSPLARRERQPRRRPTHDPAAEVASRRKQLAERGSSHLWTFIACGLVAWTLAVMAGSIWQRDRIERMLVSSSWGRPLLSQLRGEDKYHPILRNRIQQDKASATTHDFAQLADQYSVRGEYAEAIHVFRQGIARCKIPGEEASASNSLAWLLLTADDSWYRDPMQAQQLAQRAVSLNADPEYLDTLAEALFQNGHFAEAIARESEAYEKARAVTENDSDVRYYYRKLLKFQQDSRPSAYASGVAEVSAPAPLPPTAP